MASCFVQARKLGSSQLFKPEISRVPRHRIAAPRAAESCCGKAELGEANDIWSESDLPINVGEYDFKSIITQVESNRPLLLDLPVKNQNETKLLVPPFAVREWRLLLDKN